jgi:1,2-diacylglycerol 3-alpha-glucosyltransferase
MNIGFFTDTYFPQVSGVATSIQTLKNELESYGHVVYIFTTTDPRANNEEEERIIRLPSIPFISFKDRRIIVRRMVETYRIAHELALQLIHNHTEFGLGLLGQMVAHRMKIPVVHTWHTDYEKYLHYVAKGKVFRPVHVKMSAKFLFGRVDGVVCPSKLTRKMLSNYGLKVPLKVIPTGVDIHKFLRSDITGRDRQNLRCKLGVDETGVLLLSVSRLSREKNIHFLLSGMPEILRKYPQTRLIIVGDGPVREELEQQASDLGISGQVCFMGMIAHENITYYYNAADYMVSASVSETQGLTYAEALASGVQSVVHGNEYLCNLFDDETLGCLYYGNETFADALIGYIEKSLEIDEKLLQMKLYGISAEYFGLSMLEFYFETLANFSKKQLEKKRILGLNKIGKKIASVKKLRRYYQKTEKITIEDK